MSMILALVTLSALTAGEGKRLDVGPGVRLEIENNHRRVIVQSNVVLRSGPLEGLLTRAKKKEHEYILAAECDARHIHTALELARAKAGKPCSFENPFKPATGSSIRITLRYEEKGKKRVVSAKDWILHDKTARPLATDWVFAGSRFGPNPEGKELPPFYLANHGDLICVVNMESALLDLPGRSPKAFNERIYKAATNLIPAIGTPVEVILEPLIPAK